MRRLSPQDGQHFRPRFVITQCVGYRINANNNGHEPGGKRVTFYVCDMLDGGKVLRHIDAKDASPVAIEKARRKAQETRRMFQRYYDQRMAGAESNGRS